MSSGVVTGIFTISGVVAGGGLDWIRTSISDRKASANQARDQIAALGGAYMRLQASGQTFRATDRTAPNLQATVGGPLSEISELTMRLYLQPDPLVRSAVDALRKATQQVILGLQTDVDSDEFAARGLAVGDRLAELARAQEKANRRRWWSR